MPQPAVARIPDDWTVWAFSDPHGMTSALLAALAAAGLVDDTGRWSAPERTALVGCGDYVDRGADVRGLVELLRRLGAEAPHAGGLAVFARGNHEQTVLHLREGRVEWLDTWIRYGGHATLSSYGVPAPDIHDAVSVRGAMDAIEQASPGTFRWLEGLPHAVRWRDLLLVHGGLPIDHDLDDLGAATDDHLWIRASFFETPWRSDAFRRYRRAGIERVVFGHTPQADGATLYHEGRSLCLDTNAVGNPEMPRDALRLMTLACLPAQGSLAAARLVTIPTGDAPEAT